ncbi:MAG TPA: hypothetical protein VMR33_22470, partial [Candidatus Baltobacteraceae bacterium]|nr:hypothetical protein [Candidatus Baltobacteraceae bacterium]
MIRRLVGDTPMHIPRLLCGFAMLFLAASTRAQVLTNSDIGAVNPNEPLGPSSRKTGIVFSEIMYKPAPRTDGNNVEFLEIFNSCPFF